MGRKRNLKLARRIEAVRPAPRQRGRFLPYAFLAVVILLSFVAWFIVHRPDEKGPTDLEIRTNISKISDSLIPTTAMDVWQMEQELYTPDSSVEAALIEEMLDRLNAALSNNRDIPEVEQERIMFGGRLLPAVFSSARGGGARWAGKDPTVIADPQRLPVVFYPRSAFNHARIKGHLASYDPNIRTVFIAALRFNSPMWHSAIVTHELWHAKRHRERAASEIQETDSDSWISEEVEAQEVGMKVLNARTNGAYRDRIKRVTTAIPGKSIKHFLASIRVNHLQEIDRLFPAPVPGESQMRAGTYILSLGFQWLEGRYTEPELGRQKIQVYRHAFGRLIPPG